MIFGKYELLERIAVGGMAEVFRARLRGDGGFEKHLVIKRILPHLSSDSDFVVMLIDEARIAVSLTHPNIVQIYDLGKQDGTYYIAMELIEGGDLKVLLHRLRTQQLRMPIAHALHIGIETLKGLEYAHQKMGGSHEQPVPLNIIHRDISPPNILISYEGEVKLVDFGIAKASVRLMETSAGILKGKYEYMSPEQAMGLVVDHRSDLFSAGVVLYELLTGHSPFAAVTDLKVLQNVRAAQCIPPSQHNPEIPPALDAIVLKSLRRERDERYQRASEMRAELNAFAFAGRHLSNAARLAGFMRSLFAEEIRLGKVAHLDQIVSGPGPGAPGGSPAPSAPPMMPPNTSGPSTAPSPSLARLDSGGLPKAELPVARRRDEDEDVPTIAGQVAPGLVTAPGRVPLKVPPPPLSQPENASTLSDFAPLGRLASAAGTSTAPQGAVVSLFAPPRRLEEDEDSPTSVSQVKEDPGVHPPGMSGAPAPATSSVGVAGRGAIPAPAATASTVGAPRLPPGPLARPVGSEWVQPSPATSQPVPSGPTPVASGGSAGAVSVATPLRMAPAGAPPNSGPASGVPAPGVLGAKPGASMASRRTSLDDDELDVESVVLELDPASTTHSQGPGRLLSKPVPPPPGRLVSRSGQESVSIPPRNAAPPGVLVSHRGPTQAEPERQTGMPPLPPPLPSSGAKGMGGVAAGALAANPSAGARGHDPFATKPAHEGWQPLGSPVPTAALPDIPTRASDATLLAGPPGTTFPAVRAQAETVVEPKPELTPRGEILPLSSPVEQDEFQRRRRMALLTGFFGGLIPGLLMAAWFSMVDRQISPSVVPLPAPILLVEGTAELRLLLDGQPVESPLPVRLSLEPARMYRLQLMRGDAVALEKTITLEPGQQLHWQLLDARPTSLPEDGTPLPPR